MAWPCTRSVVLTEKEKLLMVFSEHQVHAFIRGNNKRVEKSLETSLAYVINYDTYVNFCILLRILLQ